MANHFTDLPNSKAGDWIKFVMQTIALPVVAWLLWTSAQHETRISVMEANRFTSSDAAHMQIAVTQKDAELLSLINEARRGQAVNTEKLDRIRKDLDTMMAQMKSSR